MLTSGSGLASVPGCAHFNYAWAENAWDETSRGVRARPVGLDRKSVNTRECSTFAQSRTLTRGVRISIYTIELHKAALFTAVLEPEA